MVAIWSPELYTLVWTSGRFTPACFRMLEALLHGKLSRNQENMEDILASSVSGLLQLMPATELGRFLAMASDEEGCCQIEAELSNFY